MEPVKDAMTLCEFYNNIVKPRADAGDPQYKLMWETWIETTKGLMTPERAREYAKKIIP